MVDLREYSRRHACFVDETAPAEIADVACHHVRRDERAYGRTRAVRTDQPLAPRTRAIVEHGGNAVRPVLYVDQGMVSEVVGLVYLATQETIDEPPGRHDLVHGLGMQHVTILAEQHAPMRFDAHLCPQLDAGSPNRCVEFVVGRDAGAAIGERFAGAFIDGDRETLRTQRDGCEQAGHRAANDDHMPAAHGVNARRSAAAL